MTQRHAQKIIFTFSFSVTLTFDLLPTSHLW